MLAKLFVEKHVVLLQFGQCAGFFWEVVTRSGGSGRDGRRDVEGVLLALWSQSMKMMVVSDLCIRVDVMFVSRIRLEVDRLLFGFRRVWFGSHLGASCERKCTLGCRK